MSGARALARRSALSTAAYYGWAGSTLAAASVAHLLFWSIGLDYLWRGATTAPLLVMALAVSAHAMLTAPLAIVLAASGRLSNAGAVWFMCGAFAQFVISQIAHLGAGWLGLAMGSTPFQIAQSVSTAAGVAWWWILGALFGVFRLPRGIAAPIVVSAAMVAIGFAFNLLGLWRVIETWVSVDLRWQNVLSAPLVVLFCAIPLLLFEPHRPKQHAAQEMANAF